MDCFADINVSQGSVATYGRCGGTFNIHLTANLSSNLPVKKLFKSVKIYRIMVTSLWPRFFWPTLYIDKSSSVFFQIACDSSSESAIHD